MSKNILQLGLKKIKLNFEYDNQLVTLSAEPYKTIIQLKAKAMKMFFPCPKELKTYYLNRDISKHEYEKIGTFFFKKENIYLKLVEGANSNQYIPGSSPRKDQKEFDGIVNIENNFSKKNNKKDTINYMTPPMQKETKPILKEDQLLNEKIQDSQLLCQLCNENKFTIFCRNCQMFLCGKCRNDQTHKSHLTINVNGKTLIESVKLYAMIIQTDIETSNTGEDEEKIKEEDAKEDNNEKEDDNTDVLDNEIQTKHDEILEKMQSLDGKYKRMMYVFKEAKNHKEIKEEGEEQKEEKKEENSQIAKKINSDISKILKDMNYNKENLDFDKMTNYFKQINSKEKEWEGISKHITHQKLQNDLQEKIMKMYNTINAAIEQFINEENEINIELKKINPKAKTSKITFDDEKEKEEEIPKITVNGETESQHSKEADKEKEKIEVKQKKEKESRELLRLKTEQYKKGTIRSSGDTKEDEDSNINHINKELLSPSIEHKNLSLHSNSSKNETRKKKRSKSKKK